MKNKLLTIGIVAAILIAIGVIYSVQPDRLPTDREELSKAVEEQLSQIEAVPAAAIAAEAESDEVNQEEDSMPAEAQSETGKAAENTTAEPEKQVPTETKAADVVKVKFECSNGDFIVECHKNWAPNGFDRLMQLVKEDFFKDVHFFRVVTKPNPFVVQFGISGDPKVAEKWVDARIKDDPVAQSNKPGTLTFATSGADSRTTQLFINLEDNRRLDTMGFAPIGKVVKGMDVVKSFNDKYQDIPTRTQPQIQSKGNAFLDERFPGLDYIKSAQIVK